MKLEKYSLGIGDRFAHQGKAQLKAIIKAAKDGINITPVWNKSNREHQIVNSTPRDTRKEADEAVKAMNWQKPYHVDADHINLNNVDNFIPHSDFFTIDVADYIGEPVDKKLIDIFVNENKKYLGNLSIPGIEAPFRVTNGLLREIAEKYLYAANEAGKIYYHLAEMKGIESFIPEVSMDEVEEPQSPVEMFFILKALSSVDLPLQTIAPKFTGRFNKGVDYEGDIEKFEREFEEDLLVIDYAVKEFGLPTNLKLSVHSGSDKFSIYPAIGKLIKKYNKGVHVKTAGTTWLEEVIGLALAGNEALDLAKNIYAKAYTRFDELCGPYATVIDIDKNSLPSIDDVRNWNSDKFANTLRHVADHPDYNPNFRQLIHVGYKIAADYGNEYTSALNKYEDIIGREVFTNIYERHVKRLFY